MYWNQKRLADTNELFEFLKKESVKLPQPEVHVRGDQETRYEFVGKVIYTAQRAGIQKVGFITEPPDKTGGRNSSFRSAGPRRHGPAAASPNIRKETS